MMQALELVEARKAEAAKRVAKLRTQLEAAESDLRNLEITAETLTRLNLNPSVETVTPRGQAYRQIAGVLSDDEADSKTPKDIHEAISAQGVSITQDNVRTILSRNKERFRVKDGRYWNRPQEPETDATEDEQ